MAQVGVDDKDSRPKFAEMTKVAMMTKKSDLIPAPQMPNLLELTK